MLILLPSKKKWWSWHASCILAWVVALVTCLSRGYDTSHRHGMVGGTH